MDFSRGSQRGPKWAKPTISGKIKASKLRINPAIVELDVSKALRTRRSLPQSVGARKPRETRVPLCKEPDVLHIPPSKTESRNHHDPDDPRDGSDPHFAAALAKKLSDLSVSSSREESSSSGFFSRSSDDIYALEEDEETTEEGNAGSGADKDDSDSLESLSLEESESELESESESDGKESAEILCQGQNLPPLAPPSEHKLPYRLQLLRKQLDCQRHLPLSDSLCTVDTTSSTILERPSPFLTPSLFPNCSSTIHFAVAGEIVEFVPLATKRLLKWKMSSITPNIIKNCIKRSWFTPTKRSDAWLGYWGKHMKATSFKSIRDFQKANHFPGTFQIGRKDYLWRNLSRMQHRHGRMEFSFFPQTFVLPFDFAQLKQEFETGKEKQKWIVKPPASARGIGIRVISRWSQVPIRRPAIVQRYLDRPFLINESKFDLRVYVYVSSYDPLRIYVFKDGLARFATCKYSMAAKSLSNRFMHLTNYSVNKKNSAFTPNSDETVCQGHKWGLQALWRYMKTKGIDVDALWESIKDVIVKTLISSEPAVSSLMKAHVRHSWCCHELFGFDIMLDDQLKPWVLEVNISPSLHSNSTLDENIKGQMVRDILNMAGFRVPSATKSAEKTDETTSTHMKVSSRSSGLSTDERDKHVFYIQKHLDEAVQPSILRTLTPDDIRMLIETEDEFSRRGQFERVFPTAKTKKYLKFFETPRYYNLLLDEWIRLYRHYSDSGIQRLVLYASKGVHLRTATDAEHRWCKDDSCLITRRALSAPSGVFVKTKSSRCKSSELRRGTSGLPGIWSCGSARESKSGN